MNDLDDKIRKALKESNPTMEMTNQASSLDLIKDTFRSRQRMLVGMVFLSVLLFAGLMIFSGYQFMQGEEMIDKLFWSTSFIFSTVVVSMSKIWYWMEMNKHAQTREIKRLELAVMLLTEQLQAQSSRDEESP